jgi:hypothetical protein
VVGPTRGVVGCNTCASLYRDDALRFIRDVLEEKVKANELPHCVPFYDAGYNPGQADSFNKGS